MISLVVLLPPSATAAQQTWASAPLAYVRVAAAGRIVDQGVAVAAELPHSDMTVVVVSACDTLLLKATLPPVTGPRLQRVLPNMVEDQLVQDAQRCHICVDPVPAPEGGHYIAVVDREWFASVIAAFTLEGRGRLKVVPLTRCVPLPHGEGTPAGGTDASATQAVTEKEPALALVETAGPVQTETADGGEPVMPSAAGEAAGVVTMDEVGGQPASALVVRYPAAMAGSETSVIVEVVLRQGGLGLGLEVDERRLPATLDRMVQRAPTDLYELSAAAPDVVGAARDEGHAIDPEPVLRPVPERAGLAVLPLGALAEAAMACRLDLCQFEFARSGRGSKGAKRWWQWAAGLSGAAVVLALTAVNVHWFQLMHRRDALNAQMVAVLKTTFPDISVVVDPQAQMVSRLKGLANASGALRADDFVVEAAALSRALPPVPSTSISMLDYSNGSLSVTFRPDATVDADGLRKRLASNGLSARQEDGKWILASAISRPR
ncbi:hypothetical protein CY652_13735 [Burkholderia sp. WAC0059]|uniref:type II secretion system protein GspL n=1 Tax=Burkholderia sp. WAC0059 TaxID=2066022 RepID=UPI000C7F6776|nr:type II secretion system protein GspL [Burkholderia sp. WAC0059]PLZ01743.1 hypothetical protein CY652_13735 [Burkholderia sp. WAC0059]